MIQASQIRQPVIPSQTGQSQTRDEEYLTKAFNTALVSATQLSTEASLHEIVSLSRGPAFRALLASIHKLSMETGCSESDAATEIVQLFRRLDKLWHDYVLNQGLERLKTKI